MGSGCELVGEDPDSLPRKLANFCRFMGMPAASFEKEISSLLRKLESRKGRGIEVSGGKRKPFSISHVKRET